MLEITFLVHEVRHVRERRDRFAEGQGQVETNRKQARTHDLADRFLEIWRGEQHRARGEHAMAIGRDDPSVYPRVNSQIVGVDDYPGRQPT